MRTTAIRFSIGVVFGGPRSEGKIGTAPCKVGKQIPLVSKVGARDGPLSQ